MWDNRQTKKNPKQPDYKCKDKEGCGKGVWEDAKKTGGGNGSAPATGKRPLGRLYFECLKIAAASVKNVIGDKATPEDIIAATATIFIAASQTGAPLVGEKAKPAPPPPKPEPEPEPEYQEEYEDNLPF